MKESINNVTIEGLVSEINIREIDKDSKKYFGGEVVVEVTDAKGQVNLIPVSFFTSNVKKDGTPNKIYENLMALKSFNSIASAGRDDATKVQIRGAKIEENMFLPANGEEVIATSKISSNFFTKVNDHSFKPQNTFSLTGYICKMEDEMKNTADGEEATGRLIITLGVVGYGDRIQLVKLIAAEAKHIDFIRTNWAVGNTVQVGGNVCFTEEQYTQTQEVGFGEAEERTYTRRKREFIITRGSAGPLEDENSYAESDITAALVARNQRKEEVKNKAKSAPKATPASTLAAGLF